MRRFARNLRAARKRAGLTQAALAAKLGMGDEMYARYERARMCPSLDRLCRMCDVLGCSADALLGIGEPLPVLARPPQDPPAVRRLLRELRKADPGTVYVVNQVVVGLARHEAMVAAAASKGGKGGKRRKR